MDEIAPEDIAPLLHGRMGLILGPGVTKSPTFFRELRDSIAGLGGIEPCHTLFSTGDALLEKNIREAQIADRIRELLGHERKCALVTHLIKNRWAAVLSASLDSHFEDDYRQYVEQKKPSWPQVVAMTDPTLPHPANTIPVLKLLGAAYQDEFAFSTAQYLSCQTRWRAAARTFIDLVKTNPVLCVGMEECVDVLHGLLREFLTERTTTPSNLLLLADDPLVRDRTLLHLARPRVRLVAVRGTVGDVCRAATAAVKNGLTPAIEFPDDRPELAPLHQFRDLVTVVNECLEPALKRQETTQLHDLLFAPSIARWDAQAHGLDFRRTQSAMILNAVSTKAAAAREGGTGYVLTGPAACGKTMVLKRVAYDLAKAGSPVLWLTPWAIPDRAKVLKRLFEIIATTTFAKNRRVIVVVDDPVGGGTLARDAAFAARSAEMPFLLFAAVRTSDWHVWDRAALIGNLAELTEFELSDSLDDGELAALPQYLTQIGLASDDVDAGRQIDAQAHRGIRDTLCMLYYLLPYTKSVIASSVRQEYNRLDSQGLRSVLLGTLESTPGILKRAYEYVAVANRYKVSLPIEVLVGALGIEYATWVDATSSKSAAWGFLYAIESEEMQTVLYRTRNDIVNSLIVEMVNGGSISHAGEVAALQKLLTACSRGTLPIYRDFCHRVLVPSEKLRHLDFAEGLLLYDAGIAALPHKDRTLLHHKGLWIKNQGKDPLTAIRVLEQALEAPPTPHAERNEADEHIHTSLAATKLEAVKRKKMTLEEGKIAILGHLANAKSADFFNPNSLHVQANTISELIDQLPQSQLGDLLALVNQGVAELDRALLTLNGLATNSPDYVHDLEMLKQKKGELLEKVHTVRELEAIAVELWNKHRNQDGFIIVARKMFAEAQQRDTRFEPAFAYAKRCILTCEDAKVPAAPALIATAVEIYYYWRVQRAKQSRVGPIDWSLLSTYTSHLLAGTALADEPLYRYLSGLSLAHLDRWPDAMTQFAQLRRSGIPKHVMWTRMDQLKDEEGNVRVVQGVVKESMDRTYLFVEQLQRDFHASRFGSWPRAGLIAFATIDFSYGGPTAYPRQRGSN